MSPVTLLCCVQPSVVLSVVWKQAIQYFSLLSSQASGYLIFIKNRNDEIESDENITTWQTDTALNIVGENEIELGVIVWE